jgi:Ca2+-binding RTX toxin-like protein
MGNGLGGLLKDVAKSFIKEAAEQAGNNASDSLADKYGGMTPEDMMRQHITNENYVGDMHELGLKEQNDWDFTTPKDTRTAWNKIIENKVGPNDHYRLGTPRLTGKEMNDFDKNLADYPGNDHTDPLSGQSPPLGTGNNSYHARYDRDGQGANNHGMPSASANAHSASDNGHYSTHYNSPPTGTNGYHPATLDSPSEYNHGNNNNGTSNHYNNTNPTTNLGPKNDGGGGSNHNDKNVTTTSNQGPKNDGGAGVHTTTTNTSNRTSDPDNSPAPHAPTTHNTSADSQGKGGGSTNSDPHKGHDQGTGAARPIILDLAGTGINICELTRSNKFMDSDGTGKLHRTAWAGVGSGVLFYDPKSLNAVAEKNQYVFTEWDPTAKSDLEALRNVFDSNGDGKLDATDAKFGLFKVEVTNADGTTSVYTLAQLGITSINLKADLTDVKYSDGSEITGQTSFTRSNGTTGLVASMALASEVAGYAMTQVVTTDAGNNRVETNTAFTDDGSIANVTKSTTSVDGKTISITYDNNGDGVIDKSKTILTVVDGLGTKTETLINKNGGGVLIDSIQTITSSDGKSITINRDTTGGGWYNLSETRTTFVDGHRTLVVTDKNADGSEIHQATTTVSIDGLTRSVATDIDSNAIADRINTHALVNNADGSRTETTTDTSANGTLLDRVVTNTSVNGRVQTSTFDFDGNSTIDKTVNSTITVNADTTTNSVTSTTNGDGSLRNTVTVAQSADSLSSTETDDINGDGVIDLKTVDVMVINADTSRDHTVSVYNTNNTLRSKVTTHIGADRISETVTVDSSGNGRTNSETIVAVSVGGVRTATTSNYNTSGLPRLINKVIATTSADGLSTTSATDVDGDGTVDLNLSDVTVKNGDGTATHTLSSLSGSGVLYGQTVQTVSANGLSVNTQVDLDGVGGFDFSQNDVREVFGDLSTRHTITSFNANGTLHDQTITNATADRRSVTVTADVNGDGAIDRTETIVKVLDGRITDTAINKNKDGSIKDQVISHISANGLSQDIQFDRDGNGLIDQIKTDNKVYNADGSTTETITNLNSNGSLINKQIISLSGNGLIQTNQMDMNGDGIYDVTTVDTKVLNSNGSVTETIANKNSLGTITSQLTTTRSASGLSTTTTQDINGDGIIDFTTTDVIVLSANGSQTETVRVVDVNGKLRTSDVSTTTADHLNMTIDHDVNGDGKIDQSETFVFNTLGVQTLHVLTNYNVYQEVQNELTTYVSDNGMAQQSYILLAPQATGWPNLITKDINIINADGSNTEYIRKLSWVIPTDVLTYNQVITTSASGLTVTTQTDEDGNATFDTTLSDVMQILANGSVIETLIDTNNNGTIRDKTIITTSADKLSTVITRDVTGEGNPDQTEQTTIAADGKTTHDIASYTLAGALTSDFKTVTTANGLSTIYTANRNGLGNDLTETSTTILGADGSKTTTILDQNISGVMINRSVKTVSDDGYTKTLLEDRNGDSVNELVTNDVTVFNADGSRTRTTSVTNNLGALRDKLITTVSANGLSSSTSVDFNGDGTSEHTVVFSELGDTSSAKTTTFKKLSGASYEIDRQTMSSDGRQSIYSQDLDGNGTFDRVQTTTTDLNKTTIYELKDLNAAGANTQQIKIEIFTNEQLKKAFIDTNGDGVNDFSHYETITYSATGQKLDAISTKDGYGIQIFLENIVTDPNGFHSISNYDFFGDGVVDEKVDYNRVIAADGIETTTIATTDAANKLVDKSVTIISANGLNTTTTIDNTADGVIDRRVAVVDSIDGKSITTNTEYSNLGVQTSQVVTTQSSDGSRVVVDYFNAANQLLTHQTTDYASNSLGSYTWTEVVGTTTQTSTHTFDATGVDTWKLTTATLSYSTTLDADSESNLMSIAERLFDTLLDRDMYATERETLVKYIVDGNLNRSQLVTDVLASVEFTSKYGAISNAGFLLQVYRNAVDRAPTLLELQNNLTALTNATATRASIVLGLSETSEHIFNGLEHIYTNNTNLNVGGLTVSHQIDHTYDSAKALFDLQLLADTVYDQYFIEPSRSQYTNYLLDGTKTEAQLAAEFLVSTDFTSRFGPVGSLTNAAFVNRMFVNTLQTVPSAAETSTWVNLLNSGAISRADMALSLALSNDHLTTGNSNVNFIDGTNLNDTITGGALHDVIAGHMGADKLNGGVGNDAVTYGDSSAGVTVNLSLTTAQISAGDASGDILTSIERVFGSAFDDYIVGDVNVNQLMGRAGNDTLSGGLGADMIVGGEGYDNARYYDSSAAVTVNLLSNVNTGGDAEGDRLYGIEIVEGSNAGNDVITGNDFANWLYGRGGNDTLKGGEGDDYLEGGVGADNLQGGEGYDTVGYYDSALGVTINLSSFGAASDGDASGDSIQGFEGIIGSNVGADYLTGDANANTILGYGGNDQLAGGGGADYLDGGAGGDMVRYYESILGVTVFLGLTTAQTSAGDASGDIILNFEGVYGSNLGDDVIFGDVNANWLYGFGGNDQLSGGGGADYLDGGDGAYDILRYYESALGVTVDLNRTTIAQTSAGDANGDTVLNFERVYGSAAGNDTLTGNSSDNVLWGFGGDDTLNGDIGNDQLDGGIGADKLDGGSGVDFARYYDSTVGVTVNLGLTTAQISAGEASGDILANIENIEGSNVADDYLTGNTGDNYILGRGGNDQLAGGIGADTLDGGTGFDMARYYESTLGVTVNLALNTAQISAGEASGDVLYSIEGVYGSNLGDDFLIGDVNANSLYGFAGNDQLSGGAGADYLDGGVGFDMARYYESTLGVTVDLNLTVAQTSAGDASGDTLLNIEGVYGSNIGNDAIYGDANANALYGFAGNDLLSGGAGSDSLVGGLGDDIYVVDNVGDVTTENVNEGIDVIQSSITWTLGNNFENLTLLGTVAINATGNISDNVLNGNSAANILDGGVGIDTMIGGTGNDIYIVDNAADIITEVAGGGVDLVQSTVSWTLGAELENLTLLGSGALNGTGNALSNIINGTVGNNTLNGLGGIDTLVGGLGDDIYVVDVAGVITTEAAAGGIDTVQSSITWTLASEIENLTLTGVVATNGIGNSSANILVGNSADNIIDGGTGTDTLIGGLGNDTYIVDNVGDATTENLNEGTDLVQSSITWTLGNNFENLTLTGSGAINATGNTLNNILNGNGGINVLDGGAGADTMIGGAGNTTYIVDNIADITTELALGGIDNVQTSISWTLANEVENLTLTGTTNINGAGNSAVNVITGNVGDNILNGAGGIDTLVGGLGNDTYVVDVAGVITTEAALAGTDIVQASINWTLATELENLVLMGAAAINGTGNTVANVITGNSANNILDGAAGADTLIGGLGNDTYVVDNIGDVTTENLNEGTDLVQASIAWALATNLENLTLTGTAAINATGNALDNILTGNAGNNILDGGLGLDTMIGGAGNDTYIVDSVGDITTELAAGGTDLVQSSISWTLGSEFENLTLIGAAVNGTGNALANTITGNAANNILNGGGGSDTLIGGLGDDTFVIDNLGVVTTEAVGAGIDTVQSSVAWTLAANIENLTLTGTALISGTGNTLDNIIIGNGNNNILNGGAGADRLDGGLGTDMATYAISAVGVTVDMTLVGAQTSTGDAGGDTLLNIENLTGSAFVDTLTGDANANIIDGGAGNDFLYGGAGNDLLAGGAGADRLDGGLGSDYAYYYYSTTALTASLATNTGTAGDALGDTFFNLENLWGSNTASNNLTGDANTNYLTGGSVVDTIDGGAGGDYIGGNDGADIINGGLGSDTSLYNSSTAGVTVNLTTGVNTGGYAQGDQLTSVENVQGSNFNDTLTGEVGINQLWGNGGNDTLTGAAGDDWMSGGIGNDTFVFTANFGKDTISDFTAGAGVADVMQFTLGTAFDTFGEIIAAATQVGANTVINISAADTITLTNVLKTALVADDFTFV